MNGVLGEVLATLVRACLVVNNTTGTDNSAFGFNALNANSVGVATGTSALSTNGNGVGNTATGANTLKANSDGNFNTAIGDRALSSNNHGNYDTASGEGALYSNTKGEDNTAAGVNALVGNTTGAENTATGANALASSAISYYNTASGADALVSNTTGNDNTADGYQALDLNSSGYNNTASERDALFDNTTGDDNTAIGIAALFYNTSGSNNIGIGPAAGRNLTFGSNNIDIGAYGVAGESNRIRIGTTGTQHRVYIAGISTSFINGSPVIVSPSGRLGVQASSARFKRDIHDMGDASSRLLKLRPVSFRYKQDPTKSLQYGLIAEEVERVYPELVIHDDHGKAMGVRCDMLPALLVNEVQKLEKENRRKDAQIAAQQKQINALRARTLVNRTTGRPQSLQFRIQLPVGVVERMVRGTSYTLINQKGSPCVLHGPPMVGTGPSDLKINGDSSSLPKALLKTN